MPHDRVCQSPLLVLQPVECHSCNNGVVSATPSSSSGFGTGNCVPLADDSDEDRDGGGGGGTGSASGGTTGTCGDVAASASGDDNDAKALPLPVVGSGVPVVSDDDVADAGESEFPGGLVHGPGYCLRVGAEKGKDSCRTSEAFAPLALTRDECKFDSDGPSGLRKLS